MKRYRSSINGRFVRKEYADQNPHTTVAEAIRSELQTEETLTQRLIKALVCLFKIG